MKRKLLLVFACFPFFALFSQTEFNVEGTLGVGLNGSEMINPILIEGRWNSSDYFSGSLGLGIWNTGFKHVWEEGDNNAFTIYHLNDNKTLATIQGGIKIQYPIVTILTFPLWLFIEPKVYFLPYTSRNPSLKEDTYTINLDKTASSGNPVYDHASPPLFTMQSASALQLGFGIQFGFATEIQNKIRIGVGFGYSNLDFFKQLRGKKIHNTLLDSHLPNKGLKTILLSLSYPI